MPLYEYQCLQCGTRTETLQNFNAPKLTTCEKCGGELKRLLSAPAVQFKGAGWYVTDYARKSGAPAKSEGRSESGGGESKSGEGKSTEGKSGEGKSGEGTSGDTRSGEGKSSSGGSESRGESSGAKADKASGGSSTGGGTGGSTSGTAG